MSSTLGTIRQSFLAGLLALLPLYITVQVLLLLFNLVDGVLGPAINELIQATTPIQVHIPGLGLAGTLLIVLAIGWAMRMMFFKRVMALVEAVIERIPIVKSLYKASQQIVVPFADKSKIPFSKVVLVEYPMVGRQTLGLVARDRITDDPADERMVVFFPSNHLHLGYPVVLSSRDVTVIDMSVEDAIKFFVSCGVVGDDRILRAQGRIIADNLKGWPDTASNASFDLPA